MELSSHINSKGSMHYSKKNYNVEEIELCVFHHEFGHQQEQWSMSFEKEDQTSYHGCGVV
jgi:hypothetical protein